MLEMHPGLFEFIEQRDGMEEYRTVGVTGARGKRLPSSSIGRLKFEDEDENDFPYGPRIITR